MHDLGDGLDIAAPVGRDEFSVMCLCQSPQVGMEPLRLGDVDPGGLFQ
jgi:hypothetical protein